MRTNKTNTIINATNQTCIDLFRHIRDTLLHADLAHPATRCGQEFRFKLKFFKVRPAAWLFRRRLRHQRLAELALLLTGIEKQTLNPSTVRSVTMPWVGSDDCSTVHDASG